jgi:alkylated DNA repair dioxygenase AlkB
MYTPNFVAKLEIELMFSTLREQLPWERRDATPRSEYWTASPPRPYTYGRGAGRRTYMSQPTMWPIERCKPPSRQMLQNGSLFLMPAGFQQTYQHKIPKAGFTPCGPRISLTFRALHDPVDRGDPYLPAIMAKLPTFETRVAA